MALAIENASIGTPLNSGSAATTGTLTTNVTIASGATIILGVLGHAGISTVADNSGNGYGNWPIDKTHANGGAEIGIVSIYASSGLASGTTITATFSASSNVRMMRGLSYTGGPSGTRLDATPVSQGFFAGSTAWACPSLTPATAPSIVFGLFSDFGTAPNLTGSTPDSGWTEWGADLIQGDTFLTCVYQIVANTTARAPSGVFNATAGGDQNGITANYKEGAGGQTRPYLNISVS